MRQRISNDRRNGKRPMKNALATTAVLLIWIAAVVTFVRNPHLPELWRRAVRTTLAQWTADTTLHSSTPLHTQAEGAKEETASPPNGAEQNVPAALQEALQSRASVGRVEHGQNAGERILATPVRTLWEANYRSVLMQVENGLKTFKTLEGRGPKNHQEFMEKIVKAGSILLPGLPQGERYVYDPAKEALFVEQSRPPVLTTQEPEWVAFSLAVARQRIAQAGGDWRNREPEIWELAGINRVVGLVRDGENDVILLGRRDTRSPPLTLDHLVVALRARLVLAEWPAATTDPLQGRSPSATPHSDLRQVRFMGGIEDTTFGLDLLAAECLLLQLQEGVASPSVGQFKSFRERVAEAKADRSLDGEEGTFRFWFRAVSPVSLAVRRDGDRDICLLRDVRVGVFTELVRPGRVDTEEHPAVPRKGPATDFADSLTNDFAKLADHNPILGRLQGLFELGALTGGAESMGLKATLQWWLTEYMVEKVETPRTVDISAWRPPPFTSSETPGSDSGARQLPQKDISGMVAEAAVLQMRAGDIRSVGTIVLLTRPSSGTLAWLTPLQDLPASVKAGQ